MKKKQIFYVFDEHTDYIKECKKNGFVPIKYDGYHVKQFEKFGKTYSVLGRNDCYSGWEINIILDDVSTFEELMHILIDSHVYDEKVVSIGLMLKNYYEQFIAKLSQEFPKDKFNIKKKKIVKLITQDVCENSFEVSNMKELLEICKKIKS